MNETIFQNKAHLVQERLKYSFERMNQYLTAHNYFSKYINEGNKKGKWHYPVPEPLFRLQRVNPLRTLNWFSNTKAVSHWAKVWDSSFENKSVLQNDSTQDLLPEILCSAMLYGGLCVTEAITSFANLLILKPDEMLFSHNKLFWIDLEFDDGTQILNKRLNNGSDDKELSLKRWYPDNLTLLRINKYLANDKNQQSESKQLNSISCWKMIKTYLTKVDSVAAKPLKSFTSFCRSAIGYTENLKGIDINETLVEYAIGRNLSASLSQQSQINLFQSTSKATLNTRKFSTNTIGVKNSRKQQKTLNQVTYEPLIESIRESIKTHDHKGVKISQTACQDKFEAILTEYDVPISCVYLLEWFIFLLNKNKVSTINTYFSSIGMMWISNTIDLDLGLLDETELENVYLSMLDDEFTEKAKAYKEGRLKQIHTFCHRQFSFPYLDSFDAITSNNLRGFVRSEFITEHQFSSIINTIDDITNIENIVDKYSLKCILIIAYRSGMRLSEVLKLRLHEVENSEMLWAYIINNRIDNNKTYASKRKLPLRLLLTNEELTFVRAFFRKRFSSTKNETNTLLFSESLNEYAALDKQAISKVFKFIVSQLFEPSLTFHHLRHTALSRLQLIIEGDTGFLELITIYTIEQIRDIQSILGSYHRPGVNKDKYWALAGFAGHNTPETTLYSYLHFTDRLLGKQLSNLDMTVNKNELNNIAGLSVKKINSVFKERSDIQLKEAILLIEHNLARHSKKVGLNTLKKINGSQKNSTNLEISQKMNQGFDVCIAALKQAEKGASIIEICNQLSIDEHILKKWLINSQYLSSLKTTKGKPRLFSPKKIMPMYGTHLLPPMMVSHIESKDVATIVNALRKMYKQEKSSIQFCLKYFLENKNHESPGISFKAPKKLKIFINLLSKVLPKSRLNINFSPLYNICPQELSGTWASSIKKANLNINGGVMKNKNIYPNGKMELFLSHPEEKELTDNRGVNQYSTNALGFVFHMLAIMTLN